MQNPSKNNEIHAKSKENYEINEKSKKKHNGIHTKTTK